MENIRLLEGKMLLNREQYLTGELGQVTITIRNPTASPLSVLAPFQTGQCYVVELPDPANPPPPPAYPDNDGGGYDPDYNAPIIILAPGQELTSSTPKWCSPPEASTTPGSWRVVYGYDQRIYADFTTAKPTRATAITSVRLPPEEIAEYQTQNRFLHSDTVILLVVEVAPRDYRLVRAAMFEDISRRLNLANPVDCLRQLHGFETVGTFDEEVTSLQAELRSNHTIDVTARTVTDRQSRLNVSARPVKPGSVDRQ
jgi:hypothetical protein